MSAQHLQNTESGAVLFEDCPTRRGQNVMSCKCGRCVHCGFPKHTAIHGPVNNGGAGSKPFGHEFEPGALGKVLP